MLPIFVKKFLLFSLKVQTDGRTKKSLPADSITLEAGLL